MLETPVPTSTFHRASRAEASFVSVFRYKYSPAAADTPVFSTSHVTPPSRESEIVAVAPDARFPAFHRSVAPCCASSVPPSLNVSAWTHAFVRDLLACAVPPYAPTFSRPPFGLGSAPTAAAGSPASISGECTVSFSNFPVAGFHRPVTLFGWKSPFPASLNSGSAANECSHPIPVPCKSATVASDAPKLPFSQSTL